MSMGGSLWLVYKIMQQMDPTTATRKQIKVAQNQIRRRLKRKVDLTNVEMVSCVRCIDRTAVTFVNLFSRRSGLQ